MKKTLSFLLAIMLVLSLWQGIALAIGEELADDCNLQGDIQSEKEMEGQFFKILGLSSLSTATSLKTPYAMVAVGVGAASSSLYQIAKPENAIWENWPMSRYVFHHVPAEKLSGTLAVAERAVASSGELIANITFLITKSVTRFSINVIVLAFHTDIIASMVGWVSDGVASIFKPGGDLTNLIITIGTIFMLAYASFRLLRGQAMSSLNAVFMAALAVGCVFFFTANAKQIITSVSGATDALAGTFLGAIGEYTSDGQNININDPTDRGLVLSGQTVWEGIVAKPWAMAMFGTIDESKLKLTKSEYDAIDKDVFPEATRGNIKTGMRIDTLFLGCSGDGRDAVAESIGRPNAKLLWIPRCIAQGKEIDHGAHPGTVVGMHPSSVTNHIMVAWFTLFPAFGLALLAATVALSILVCQAVLAALLLVLPMALFAMMIPETGWRIASNYFKTLASFFMVKLIYGIYLSLILTMATFLSQAAMEENIGLAMIVMAAIFYAAAFYRKKFLNLIFDSVKKGTATVDGKLDTKKIIANSTKMARRLGVTDVLTDWWFNRDKKQNKSTTNDSYQKAPTSEDNQKSDAITPEVLGSENNQRQEGRPSLDTPYIEVKAPSDDNNSKNQSVNQPSEVKMLPAGRGKQSSQQPKSKTIEVGSLDTSKAIPPGIKKP